MSRHLDVSVLLLGTSGIEEEHEYLFPFQTLLPSCFLLNTLGVSALLLSSLLDI